MRGNYLRMAALIIALGIAGLIVMVLLDLVIAGFGLLGGLVAVGLLIVAGGKWYDHRRAHEYD